MIEPFERHYDKYEEWFEKNKDIYELELNAIKSILPDFKKGLEIGIGTGRFALPLGIKEGIEPSEKMAEIARHKGLIVKKAYAENLPYDDNSFDFILMVTTMCFLDNVNKAFSEIYRILMKNGYLMLAFVDKDSYYGEILETRKKISKFYNVAKFVGTSDLLKILKMFNFKIVKIIQTLFQNDKKSIREGFGEGGFVVILSQK